MIAGGSNLQIGDGATSGSIVGNVIDNANLAFNRSDAVTYSGNISGSGTKSLIRTDAEKYFKITV